MEVDGVIVGGLLKKAKEEKNCVQKHDEETTITLLKPRISLMYTQTHTHRHTHTQTQSSLIERAEV